MGVVIAPPPGPAPTTHFNYSADYILDTNHFCDSTEIFSMLPVNCY